MKRIHIALSTHDIARSVAEYSKRLGANPISYIPNEYALWRTNEVNLSIRKDRKVAPGTLRHLGFEDSDISGFSATKDVNGILWESFNTTAQDEEIARIWPGKDTLKKE